MSPAPEGNCWLCNKYGKLTKEHIPPASAFNDFPLLFEKVVERSKQTEVVEWEAEPRDRGLCFRSLCQKCNNNYGRLYGEAYVKLVKRISERIGDVREFHKLSLFGIKRPLAILKQVMLQFVTANGFSGEQSDNRLTPIQWSQYPFDYAGSVDWDLSLNPVASAYPLDFRTAAEVKSTPMKAEDTNVTRPSDEDLREIISKVIRISGEKDSWIWSGNPKTMRKIVDRK